MSFSHEFLRVSGQELNASGEAHGLLRFRGEKVVGEPARQRGHHCIPRRGGNPLYGVAAQDLEAQVKKLQPKKPATRKRKTTTKRKRSPLDLFE